MDPLDGTTNFAHGYPVYNVTLALEKAGELIAGVIFDPDPRRIVHLRKRRGRISQRPPHSCFSAPASSTNRLFSTGFPSRRRHLDVNIHFYHQLAMASHGVRRGGAAALDLAYVACGRLDGFWEFGLSPWDMAAGQASGGQKRAASART